jgi:hypothetical protein
MPRHECRFVEWEAEVSGSGSGDEFSDEEEKQADDGFINDEPEEVEEEEIHISAEERVCSPDELANLDDDGPPIDDDVITSQEEEEVRELSPILVVSTVNTAPVQLKPRASLKRVCDMLQIPRYIERSSTPPPERGALSWDFMMKKQK